MIDGKVMSQITSRDGTTIAYEESGQGAPVLLVDGAMGYREYLGGRPLASELSTDFKVITYDRRGRGQSADTQPYSVEREIEDIDGLIDAIGAPIFLYGTSSGAVLALKAAAKIGDKIAKLAIYEPPISMGSDTKQEHAEFTERMAELIAENKLGEAVTFFLADMLTAEALEDMKGSPEWKHMESVVHTVAYENAILGDGTLPNEDAAAARMPALVLDGDASFDFMRETAEVLAGIMPNAQRKTLAGQTHRPKPKVIAPVLMTFFNA